MADGRIEIDTQINNDDVDKGLRQIESKLNSLGGSLKSTGESLSSAATVPLLAIGAGALKVAADFDAATSKLQGQLGITAEEAKKLGTVAQGVWEKGFGESLGEVSDELARMKQQFGDMNDADLSQLLESGYAMRDLFGFELNESTRTASVMMKTFGIEGQQAMDLITVAAQRGGDFSDELLDTMREYSPQFKALGYDAEQFTAILIAGAEAGAFNLDKVGDAAKESFLRIGDGSKASREAISDLGLDFKKIEHDIQSGGEAANGAFAAVASAIATVEDPAEKAALSIALFGTPLEDLGPEFRDFFATVNTDLGNFEGSAKKAADTLEQSFGQRVQSLFREAQSALLPLGNVLMDLVENILPLLKQSIDFISDAFTNMSPTTQMIVVGLGILVAAIGPLLVIIGTLITSVGTVIGALAGISLPIVAVIAGIGLLVAALVAAYQNSETFRENVQAVFTKIKEIAVTVFETVASFIGEKIAQIKQFWDENGQQFLQAVENAFNKIKAVVEFVMPAVKLIIETVWNAIKDVINGALDIIMGAVKIFTGLFTGDFSKMWEGVKQIFSGAIDLIIGWLTLSFFGGIRTILTNLGKKGIKLMQSMWDDIVTKYKGGISKAKGFINDLFSSVSTIFTKIVSTVRTKMGEVKNWISTKWEEAQSFLTGIGPKLIQVGKDIIAGLIKGITDKFEKVASTISELANFIPSWVKDALGIHSPSRVMAALAKWIPEGLAVGIADNIDVVKKATQKMVDATTPDFTTTLAITKSAISTIQRIVSSSAKANAQEIINLEKERDEKRKKITEDYQKKIESIEKTAKDKKRKLTKNEIAEIKKLEQAAGKERVALSKEYGDKITATEKKASSDKLSALNDYVSSRKQLNEMSAKEEAEFWRYAATSFEDGTDEKKQALLNFDTAHEAMLNEQLDREKNFIAQTEKFFGMSLAQKLKAHKKFADAYEEGSDQQFYHDEQLFELRQKLHKDLIALNDARVKQAKDINDKLIAEEQRLKDAYDNAVESRYKSLMSFAGLFDKFEIGERVEGADLTNSLSSQVNALSQFSIELSKLEIRGLSDSLINELQAMGPKALPQLEALNRMTDAELTQYQELFEKKMQIARERAVKEMEPLKAEMEDNIKVLRDAANAELTKLNEEWQEAIIELIYGTEDKFQDMESIGKDAVQGLMDGMKGMEGALQNTVKSLIEGVSKTMKDALDIDSPNNQYSDVIKKGINNPAVTNAVNNAKNAASATTSMFSQLGVFAQPNLSVNVNNKAATAPVILDRQKIGEVMTSVVSQNQYNQGSLDAYMRGGLL